MMDGVAWPRPGAVTVAGIAVSLAGIAAGLAGCSGGATPAASTPPRAAVATPAPSTTTTVVTSTTQAPPGRRAAGRLPGGPGGDRGAVDGAGRHQPGRDQDGPHRRAEQRGGPGSDAVPPRHVG